MFRSIPMLRLDLAILARDEREVLLYLGRKGILHLTRIELDPADRRAGASLADPEAEIARCTDLLARCENLRKTLGMKRLPDATATPGPSEDAGSVLAQLEGQAHELLLSRQGLQARIAGLDALRNRVSPYRDLVIPLDRLDRSSFLHFVIGRLPTGNLDALQDKLGANVVILPATPQDNQQPVIIMTTPHRRANLDAVLQGLDFSAESLSAAEGLNAGTLHTQSGRERDLVAAELDRLEQQIVRFTAAGAGPLAACEERLELERRLLEATRHFIRTGSSVLLGGWIPETDAPAVVAGLRDLTQGRCVLQTRAPDPADPGPVPVLLHSSRWLRPFTRLVTAYGLPEYREMEPTLFVAISYIAMFGMMFGDAGQGAILALAGLATLWRGRSLKAQDMGLLLGLAGLSSVLFGILYGSYFGIPGLKALALWRDPLEGDPLKLMLAAVGMGVIVISLGVMVNIINRFRQRKVLDGILGRFGIAGLVFYWGALMLLTKYASIESHGLMTVLLILFLALPMACWTLKAPLERALQHRKGGGEPGGSWMGEIPESIVGAFEGALMYLANTTSFVRLAAYAMSHAALLMAVFAVAGALRQGDPLGGGWGLVVIILGNGVAIVLEGIIAAVQALRLEYYEFFGKFFSGTGQPFMPFCLPRSKALPCRE